MTKEQYYMMTTEEWMVIITVNAFLKYAKLPSKEFCEKLDKSVETITERNKEMGFIRASEMVKC
jgi:hypothetical protein